MNFLFYFATTATLLASIHQSDGLRCYNCHTKCLDPKEGKMNCEYANIYLNTISYNRSRDGAECPSDYAGWSDSKYIEECEKDSVCGKREISIYVKISSDEKRENAGVTSYPILDTHRVYHRVYGCMRPQIDCNRKTFDKVIRSKSSSDTGTITIAGKIVEEADCDKCKQDLCNAEEPQANYDPTNKPHNSFANRNVDSAFTWILSVLLVTTMAKLLASLPI